MMRNILVLSLLVFTSVSTYPLFKQCDDAWGENYLGYAGNRSVCLSGCLISSVSMALNDCGITLEDNQAANPGTINEWLKNNNGFEQGYGFKWNSTYSLGFEFQRFTQDAQEMRQAHSEGYNVFLHVRNNNHYVLMTGYDSENLLVNDPFYDSLSYPDSEAVKGQAAIFKRPAGCKTQPSASLMKEFLN